MAAALTTGINTYYLIQYLEDISELDIGVGDEVDINQTLVLQFIKEGYQRVVSLYDRWPWFQSIYTFNTVNNQRGYSTGFTLTNTSSTAITTPAAGRSFSDIAQIINLVNNTNGGNELIYIDQFKAESIWVGTSDQSDIPAYWSLWAGQVNLWPKPNDVYAITMRGYRVPSLSWLDNLGANSTEYVDLDTEFHMMLINFVMMRIFQYQEDPEMAAVYQRHFQEGVAIAQQNLAAPNANQPLIMSGGLLLNGAANVAYGYSYGPSFNVIPGNPSPFGRPW
jgi:hypothetical protein